MDAFTTYTVWNLCYSFSPSSGRSNFWLFCSSLLCSVCWLLPDYNTIAHCQFWWFSLRFNKSFIWSPWNLTLKSNFVLDFGEVDLCENQTDLLKFNVYKTLQCFLWKCGFWYFLVMKKNVFALSFAKKCASKLNFCSQFLIIF